jgi:hypothetical protein
LIDSKSANGFIGTNKGRYAFRKAENIFPSGYISLSFLMSAEAQTDLYAKAIIQAALVNQRLNRCEPIAGGEKTPDDIPNSA